MKKAEKLKINKFSNFYWVLLISLSIIWGSSFYAVSVALNSFQPLQIAAGRIIIGALTLSVFSYVYSDGLPKFTKAQRKLWYYSFGMGAFTNAIPFSLLSWAQTEVSSSFVGVTMSMVPFVTLTLAHFFVSGEEISYQKLVGLFVGFLGILILFDFFTFFQNWSSFDAFNFKLACCGAVFCYSLGSIITRRSPSESQLTFSASGLLAGSIIIIPITLIADGLPELKNIKSILAIIYLGLLPTGLATLILVNLIKGVGPTFLSLVNYLVPIWAIIFGVCFNSETLEVSFIIALIFILLGLCAIQRSFPTY